MNWNEVETLCTLCGTSGREHAVRDYILQQISAAGIPQTAVHTDGLGNVTVHKQGRQRANRKVLFTAHMDEVALMVTSVCPDGSLTFDEVGGVNPAAVIGRQVLVGRNLIPGVIGAKPVHLISKDDRKKPAEMSKLFCDIGADSEEEAKALGIRPGDVIYFDTKPFTMGEDTLAAKAIDDRFGCAVMLTLLREELEYDTDFAFLVQEEVGLRGAAAAARAMQPDIAVILETTTAADLPDSQGADRVCELGGGAVISFMDGRTIYDKALYDLASSAADSLHIKWQTKTKIAGGNDAGAIQQSGARVLAVSLPCRYLHAPVTAARKSDGEACEALARALVSALQQPEADA